MPNDDPIQDATGPVATQGNPAEETDSFRLIVENAVDLIVRGDAARNRTYVSPSSREVLGYEPAEMLGKHAYKRAHPEDRERTQAVIAKIGPLHPIQDLTFRTRRADGGYI